MKKTWFALNQRRGFFEKVMVHDIWKFQGVYLKGWDLAFCAELSNAIHFYSNSIADNLKVLKQHDGNLQIEICEFSGAFDIKVKKPIILQDETNFLYYAKDGFLRIELLANFWMKGYKISDLARYDTQYVKEIIIPTLKEYKPDTIEAIDNLLAGWFGIEKIPF